MDFSKEILFWRNFISEGSYRPENDETIAKAANFLTHTKLEPERTLAMCRWMGFTMADWRNFRYPKLLRCLPPQLQPFFLPLAALSWPMPIEPTTKEPTKFPRQ